MQHILQYFDVGVVLALEVGMTAVCAHYVLLYDALCVSPERLLLFLRHRFSIVEFVKENEKPVHD